MKRVLLIGLLAIGCSRGRPPVVEGCRDCTAENSLHKVGLVTPGPDFQIGQGNSNVPFAIPVYDQNGNQISLTGATVSFRYRTQTQEDAGVSGSGLVTGPAPGLATYVFSANDTTTAGTFNAQFVITLALPDGGVDGSAETFTYPQTRYLRVVVRPGP